MDDWKKQLEHYRDTGRTDARNHEHTIGGHVLRGLGMPRPEKDVYVVEQALLGAQYGHEPLWARARRLFLRCLRDAGQSKYVGRWDPQAVLIKRPSDITERMTLADNYEAGTMPLLFTRRNSANGRPKWHRVYALWFPEELQNLVPPFEVLSLPELPRYRLVAQEIEHFIGQFGPYELV